MSVKYDLAQRRKELGLTLEDVGKLVGVSKSTVRKWETGYIENMKSDKLPLLAKALRLPPTLILDYGFSPIEFSKLLDDLKGSRSEKEYAKDTGINESILSMLLMELVDEPPSLDILKKIALDNPLDFLIESWEIFRVAGYSLEESKDLGAEIDALKEGRADIPRIIEKLIKLPLSERTKIEEFINSSDVMELNPKNNYSQQEQNHIKKYRALNERDKQTIDTLLSSLYETTSSQKQTTATLSKYTREGREAMHRQLDEQLDAEEKGVISSVLQESEGA